MRKLQRVLLKLLPASECYTPPGVHLSQITVAAIRSYLVDTLGDAPEVDWNKDTYSTYLASIQWQKWEVPLREQQVQGCISRRCGAVQCWSSGFANIC
eukprot:gene5132-5372_t